jgi:hypothetical protein
MASKSFAHRDMWGHEREGYAHERPEVAYAPAKPLAGISAPKWLHWEERLGSLGAGIGTIWGVHVTATHLRIVDALWETPGPLEVCAIGSLIWLHAKWHRSTRLP